VTVDDIRAYAWDQVKKLTRCSEIEVFVALGDPPLPGRLGHPEE